jgi:hypothetical protein
LFGESEGNRPFGRLKGRLEDNIKTDLQETGREDVVAFF